MHTADPLNVTKTANWMYNTFGQCFMCDETNPCDEMTQTDKGYLCSSCWEFAVEEDPTLHPNFIG